MESPLRVNLVGTDGSGKSTVLDLLRQKLEAQGQVVVCHNPSGITYPDKIPFEPRTNPHNEPWDRYGYTRLVRSAEVEREAIGIASECGAVLLGDRDYETCHPVYYPVLMRGGMTESMTRQDWQKAFRTTRSCGPADQIFWLDVEPEVAVQRIGNGDRPRVQSHEEQATIAELRAGYAQMQTESDGRIVRVDTTNKSAREVADLVFAQIRL